MKITDKVDSIKGVGPKTAEMFEKLKIYTIEDLLRFYPRNYLSYGEPVNIDEAETGQRVAICATIQSYVDIKKIRNLKLVTCTVKDGTGEVKLVWYNSPFLKQVFHIGQSYVFVGTLSAKGAKLNMEHPEYYTPEQYTKMQSSLQPVYPLTEGLSNKMVTKAVKGALSVLSQIKDEVPEVVREAFNLLPLPESIQGVHFPNGMEGLMNCRNRLVFDEFFWFLVHMRQIREDTVKVANHYVMKEWEMAEHFMDGLPFSLTEGQKQAVEEIRRDLSGETVMNRLVQGDVGSGKTVVAEIAI